MSTSAENMMALTGRVSIEQVHDALTAERVRRELHGQQDDVGDWAHAHWDSLRVGLADARLAKLAEEENARRLAESIEHFKCGGYSFCNGPTPCDPRCDMPEMACTAGDDPLPMVTPNGWLAAAAFAAVGVCGVAGLWLLPLFN